MSDEEQETIALFDPADMEADLAKSAWRDKNFAAWFAPFAKRSVLFNGVRGETFFHDCGEFARKYRAAPADAAEKPERILSAQGAIEFFRSLDFAPLPGGQRFKPTAWQSEKARKYLGSRHNTLLAEKLAEAERIRNEGDSARADMLARDARREFASFSDSSVPCKRVMDDIDGILALAEDNPSLFTVDGELGRLLNPRLKPDNLGILLANQKVGKTTDLVTLATLAAKRVTTLFVSTGDETELKINARVATNLSYKVTQPEYAGSFAVPVPDCAHNAMGTCPIGESGEPRQARDWAQLIADGAKPYDLAEGTAPGSRTISGGVYRPCCRCFPKNDGTKEDRERRRHWKSAVWWRIEGFGLIDRPTLIETRKRFEIESVGGGMRVAAYKAGTLTVAGLLELLDSLDRLENFVPRVIVLDYADLMKQDEGRDTDKDHDGMRRIWEGLRGITSSLQLLMLTATQSNRLGGNVKTHTLQTIGRSAKAADNCTWMLTVNQTLQERRAKLMRGSMLFAREGSYDPEHQALCYQWHEIQDGFAFSAPIFCKTEEPKRERE